MDCSAYKAGFDQIVDSANKRLTAYHVDPNDLKQVGDG